MRRSRSARRTFAVLGLLVMSLPVGSSPARATCPGANGRLLVTATVHGRYRVFSMDADSPHRL